MYLILCNRAFTVRCDTRSCRQKGRSVLLVQALLLRRRRSTRRRHRRQGTRRSHRAPLAPLPQARHKKPGALSVTKLISAAKELAGLA